jgi:hypothetical protein
MSLLRTCSKQAFRPLATAVRYENTTAFNAALIKERPETEVAPIPVEKDIVAADAVSGAPGVCARLKLLYIWLKGLALI